MTAFDFRDVVRRFANAFDLEVVRERPPSYDGGVAVPGGWDTFTIAHAFIIPRKGFLDAEPTGGRLVSEVRMFVEDGLGTGYSHPARGDVFVWQEHTYRVTELLDYRPAAGFLELSAARQDVDESTLASWVDAEGGEAEPP